MNSSQADAFVSYTNKTTHWRLHGATYFVTWSLQQGHSPLAIAERELVEQALRFFHSDRYRLYAYVVMDDHVHVIATPLGAYELSKIVHSWKSFTSHELSKRGGRSGQVWLKDYYDRIIRGESDLLEKMIYVITNPQRRWPDAGNYMHVAWFDL